MKNEAGFESMVQQVCKDYHGIEAAARIVEVTGMQIETFRRAAQEGFAERANCTIFDPVTAPGTDAWRYPTRQLRTEAVEHGYRLDNPKNLPLAVSDEHKINITVSSGDERTGLILGRIQPKTKNPKGSILEAAISRNVNQGLLFPDLEPENIREFRHTMGYPTWVFLLYITDEEIRAELSLPSEMDGSDHIVGWSERIMISVMPKDIIGEDFEPETGPDILPDISIKI